MVPDAEKVVTAHLKAHPTVAATEARIVGETPSTTGAPWVQVTLIDDPPTDGGIADHHIAALIQLDCYAGKTANSQGKAKAVSLAVREALQTMHLAAHEDAVVTGAETSGGRFPDTDLGEPALQRYILTATIWMHGK